MNQKTCSSTGCVLCDTFFRLHIEEKITLIFFVVAAIFDSHFHVSFVRGVSTHLIFDFGLLVPAFFGFFIVGLIFLKIRKKDNFIFSDYVNRGSSLAFVRVTMALLIGYYAYSHTKILAPLINSGNYDDILFKIDQFLFFGYSPTLEMLKINSQWFVNLMFFSYTGFYVAFPLAIALTFLHRDHVLARRLVLGILIIDFIGLALYYLLPGLGPLFYTHDLFAHIPNKYYDLLWSGHLAIINNPSTFSVAPHNGVAAFPSLHSAHFLFLILTITRLNRWMYIIFIPWLICMYMATVFMGWHYVIDLIAGVFITVAAVWINKLLIPHNK